ncbi:protein kinase domain-containing protein [Thermomonospora umbrina]|uniref:Serine/threonine protein kinase n=1 Tax=Thermomonospora umbrina TaxID=111806 RepID=A0A3D9SLB4_9ACTN|nr:serine/threonine-protein kinase [Thermomonospora umbrina]REE96726.1 serine/threonine protein kinase [Thermomonospora umbrina]
MPGPLKPDDPQTLGGYELLGRLGAGGMGVVYLGRDRDGTQAAVKVINGDLLRGADQGHVARFRREIAALGRLGRRCTALLLDADPDADPPYLVTEYVHGPTLGAEIDRHGPLADGPLESLAVAVLAALDHIHRAGVTHRDLKPGNIVLGPYGPRVIDFGLALLTEMNTQVTATGMVIGTPAYMAPEQITGRPVDAPADVFSWAGTIVYAASGRPPFGGDLRGMGDRIAHGTPQLDGLGGRLLEVVTRALAKDPAERPTAAEALDALRGLSMTRTVLDSAALSDVEAPATMVEADPQEPQEPQEPDAWAALAAQSLAEGRVRLAVEQAEQGLRIKPSHARCLFHRGVARSRLGENGLADVRLAHESDPSDSEIALGYARELARSPLRSDNDKAWEMAPRDPQVRAARALSLLGDGDAALDEAYGLAPEEPAVRKAYARRLMREGRDLALAYELTPDDSVVRVAYARELVRDDGDLALAYELAPGERAVRDAYASSLASDDATVIEAFAVAPGASEIRSRYESYSRKVAGVVLDEPDRLRVVAEFARVFPGRSAGRAPLDPTAAVSAFDALEAVWRELPERTRARLRDRAFQTLQRKIVDNADAGYPPADSRAVVALIDRMEALNMGFDDLRKEVYTRREGPLFLVLGILGAVAGAAAYPLLAFFSDLGFVKGLVVIPAALVVIVVCLLANGVRASLRRTVRRRRTEQAAAVNEGPR